MNNHSAACVSAGRLPPALLLGRRFSTLLEILAGIARRIGGDLLRRADGDEYPIPTVLTDPTQLACLGQREAPGAGDELRAGKGSVAVVSQKMRGELADVVPLAVGREEIRARRVTTMVSSIISTTSEALSPMLASLLMLTPRADCACRSALMRVTSLR